MQLLHGWNPVRMTQLGCLRLPWGVIHSPAQSTQWAKSWWAGRPGQPSFVRCDSYQVWFRWFAARRARRAGAVLRTPGPWPRFWKKNFSNVKGVVLPPLARTGRVGSANPCQSTWGGHDYHDKLLLGFAFSFGKSDSYPGWSASNRGQPPDTKIRVLAVKSSALNWWKWWTVINWIWLNTASWLSWMSSFNELARDATFWIYRLVFLVWTLAGNISNCSCGVPIAAFRRDLVPWTNCRGAPKEMMLDDKDSGCQWLMIDDSCKIWQLLILLVFFHFSASGLSRALGDFSPVTLNHCRLMHKPPTEAWPKKGSTMIYQHGATTGSPCPNMFEHRFNSWKLMPIKMVVLCQRRHGHLCSIFQPFLFVSHTVWSSMAGLVMLLRKAAALQPEVDFPSFNFENFP